MDKIVILKVEDQFSLKVDNKDAEMHKLPGVMMQKVVDMVMAESQVLVDKIPVVPLLVEEVVVEKPPVVRRSVVKKEEKEEGVRDLFHREEDSDEKLDLNTGRDFPFRASEHTKDEKKDEEVNSQGEDWGFRAD